MERRIPLLLILDILTASYSASSSLNVSKVVQLHYRLTWISARNTCRWHYTDLVSIKSQEMANRFPFFRGWIGLRFQNNISWKWSRGNQTSTFYLWDSGQPTPDRSCAFKHKDTVHWSSDRCSNRHYFMCLDERMILVKEMKTWEEAYRYCRKLQGVGPPAVKTSNPFHLASLPEKHHAILDRETIEMANTTEVWIGLRFLAGEWVWISGDTVTSSYLPSCPSQQQYCGALDKSNEHWKTMDCKERRNFLCSIPQ